MRLKLFFLLAAVLSGNFYAAAQNYVTLYEDCNYGGRSYFLEAGNYRRYQMKIDNDRLSAIQVPYGLKVTIYNDDNFSGKSKTITDNVSCLDAEFNDNASSIVVESTLGQGVQYSQNDFVTFYTDSYSKGYSQSLRPGSYTGAQLGQLKYNISSFSISGNLQVKAYINNENLSGFNKVYSASQSYLSSSENDKIGSLTIEYKPSMPVGNNNQSGYGNGSYATFYSECNYEGNALRLVPGYYSGEKLGVLKYNIASLQVPSNLRIKAFVNNDNLYGQSTEITANSTCLDYNLKNRIGSLAVEERSGYGYNNNNNQPGTESVIIYTDDSYRGQSATLLPGTYNSMAQCNGFPDKALSSLKVPPGYTVILYEKENFGGKSYTITNSKSGFSFSGWNDRTSSIKVFRN
jgi:hypothetical protein